MGFYFDEQGKLRRRVPKAKENTQGRHYTPKSAMHAA
jgi:hypothetical protein